MPVHSPLAVCSRNPAPRNKIALPVLLLAALLCTSHLSAQSALPAPAPETPQSEPAAQTPESQAIAIVPLDSKISGYALDVSGDLKVNNGRAYVEANAAIVSGDHSTHVTLPYRGTLLVCAYTTVKLTADSSVPAGEVPGLLVAMEHGAIEMSFATTRNSDTVLTPDFRILISGPGPAEVKLRLGPQGDTCVDNAGTGAPYVLVSSVFEGGAYRVQPGQRVMFQHGSLHEVVDQEKESCGCPPPAAKDNEFPVAQSEGLAPLPKPAPSPATNSAASAPAVEPLVYQSADHAPQPAPSTPPAASATSAQPMPQPVAQKKPGFFKSIGRFFRRIFGAD